MVLLAFAGYFCDRFGASTVLLWSAIGYCTVWSIFTLGLPIWLASIVYVIPIYGLLIVSSDVLMSENSTLAERNRAIGLSSATTLLGQGIGTAIMFSSLLYLETTSLSQVAQYHWAFRIHIPMFMLAVFLAWMLVTKMDGKNKTPIDAILVPAEST